MKTCFTLVRALFILALVVAFVNGEPTYAQIDTDCHPAPNPACSECENELCYGVMCSNGDYCIWCEGSDDGNGNSCGVV